MSVTNDEEETFGVPEPCGKSDGSKEACEEADISPFV